MAKHGTPHADRIKASILILDNGCWQWQNALDPAGYGRINVRNRNARAHRISYEAFVGPIPDGLTLDHLCKNRACVNPAHLEPVTLVENIRRGTSPSAKNTVKTHCLQGHEFTEANTYWAKNGYRQCRTCRRQYARRYEATRCRTRRKRAMMRK